MLSGIAPALQELLRRAELQKQSGLLLSSDALANPLMLQSNGFCVTCIAMTGQTAGLVLQRRSLHSAFLAGVSGKPYRTVAKRETLTWKATLAVQSVLNAASLRGPAASCRLGMVWLVLCAAAGSGVGAFRCAGVTDACAEPATQ